MLVTHFGIVCELHAHLAYHWGNTSRYLVEVGIVAVLPFTHELSQISIVRGMLKFLVPFIALKKGCDSLPSFILCVSGGGDMEVTSRK